MKTAITTTAQHQAEERTAPLDRSTERHEGFAQLHAAILQAAADAPEWQAEAHELRYYSLHGPTKSKAVVQFAYRCGEAIGRMTVENSRPRLLALAAKVKANAAAFDGKPRRARVPYKTTRGNPFDAARDAVARGLESEALPLIEAACGPVFIGAGKDPRRPPLYAYAQTVTMGGIEWTIARLVAPGSVWHILHTASGRAAKTAGFPCRFRSAADTLSTLALMTDEATDSGYLQRARRHRQRARLRPGHSSRCTLPKR